MTDVPNKDGFGNIESLNNTWAIPYFGSSATQSMKEGAFQNRLETFTGTAQYDFHKKEIKPFFVPSKNTTFVNGSPVYDNLILLGWGVGVRNRTPKV